MSDERIAALERALPGWVSEYPKGCTENELRRSIAENIVAALPPDWCGHAEEIADLYDSNQTWSEVSARVCYAAGVPALVHVPAVIARLRRIEEAARALMDRVNAIDPYWDPQKVPEIAALRAALEET